MYRVVLSRRAEKAFMDLPSPYVRRLGEALQKVSENPRIPGTVKLENAPVAQYRYRVGDYCILFDIDEETETVQILDIRRRGERTYR